MTNLEYEQNTTPQIFISYVTSDKAVAKTIVDGLHSRNLNVWLDDYELQIGENLQESIRSAISASAYFLLLLSKHSIHSLFIKGEIIPVLRELQSRDITFIPILLENCEIPRELSVYQFFDMRSGIEDNLDKLANVLNNTLKIDFDKLTVKEFEELVIDLLEKLGFANLKLNNNLHVDSIVEFKHKDPFGLEISEIYIVEIKFYRHSRVNLQTVRQLIEYTKILPKVDKVLLFTNGQLTSITRDWINDVTKDAGVSIRVIDGTELKRLLLQNTDLVSKYFAPSMSNAS